MTGAYYLTAEPAGCCSCHTCTCPGCRECQGPFTASERATFAAPTPAPDPWSDDV